MSGFNPDSPVRQQSKLPKEGNNSPEVRKNTPIDDIMTKSLTMLDGQAIEDIEVPKDEEEIAKNFLERFMLNDEGSTVNQINLLLFFNSVSHYIKGVYYKRVKLFNFKLFQESLVAYMNIEDVNAFEYHDEKNRDRVQLVRQQLAEQKKGLKTVKDALGMLEDAIDKGAASMGKATDGPNFGENTRKKK